MTLKRHNSSTYYIAHYLLNLTLLEVITKIRAFLINLYKYIGWQLMIILLTHQNGYVLNYFNGSLPPTETKSKNLGIGHNQIWAKADKMDKFK